MIDGTVSAKIAPQIYYKIGQFPRKCRFAYRPVAARNHYRMNIVTVGQVYYEYHYFLLVAILVGKFLSSTVGFARK